MLVLAPLRVAQTTWMTEPKKWRQFAGLRIGLAHGPGKEEVLRNKKFQIVVLNYDGVVWAMKQLGVDQDQFQVLACDELTKLKHVSSLRYKALKPMLPSFPYRIGLTGTPAANGLMDLFGQMMILDRGRSLGKYITHFRQMYFVQDPRNIYVWRPIASLKPILYERIATVAHYLKPEEVLKLPDIVHVDLPVTMPKSAMDLYKQFADDAIVHIDDQPITAVNAAVLTGKLRQVAGGAVYSVDGVVMHLHDAKLDALDDLIEELAGEPLLVAYNFTHELTRILHRHPDAKAIKGGMTAKEVNDVITAWNNGETEVLCLQPTAAAAGLNLQFGGSCMVWFSPTYNLEEYIQLIARVYRQGQTQVVRVYHILAQGTIEHRVRKQLAGKDVTQAELFTALHSALKNFDADVPF
jgi:SNF2 family DNA or RNA helicase